MADDMKITKPRGERRDAAENRQRILNVAYKLFEEKGFEQVTMNEIAVEAQIGPGTLYRRYSNKNELYLDLIKDSVLLLFKDIEEYLDQNQSRPPNQRLRGILSMFIPYIEKTEQLLAGGKNPTSANQPPLPYLMSNPLYDKMHQLFVALFDEMTETKQPHPQSVFRADMLLKSIESYFFQRHIRGHSPSEILEYLCSTFISLENASREE